MSAGIREQVGSGYGFEDEYGYSRAVRVGGHVFVSGTTARGEALTGDTFEQARAALLVIEDALAALGASMRHVVRTVVYVVDLSEAASVARAHRAAFGDIRPASTLVQVAALTPAAARVEIEVTAVISG